MGTKSLTADPVSSVSGLEIEIKIAIGIDFDPDSDSDKETIP